MQVVEPRLPAAGRSGTKAEESSGLDNTFPPGGNEHSFGGAESGSGHPYHRGLIQHLAAAPLDSGLRRNDDKGVVMAARHAQHTVILDGPTPAGVLSMNDDSNE